jgi:hypothetical protein
MARGRRVDGYWLIRRQPRARVTEHVSRLSYMDVCRLCGSEGVYAVLCRRAHVMDAFCSFHCSSLTPIDGNAAGLYNSIP